MFYYIFLIFIRVIFANPSQQQENGKLKAYCPIGMEKWEESCYFLSKQKRTWFSALADCRIFDTAAVLTDINNKEESDFLQKLIQDAGYKGCYKDAMDRLLPNDFMESTTALTNTMCIDYCRSKGYRYAGTQYSIQCFCGMNIEKYNETDILECSTMCAGNKDERCGGHWRLSVYEIDRSRHWIGGICIGNDLDWQWYTNLKRQPTSGFLNWDNSVKPCRGTTCMDMGPTNPGYKWNEQNCLEKLTFICKAPVRYHPLLQRKYKPGCVKTCEGMLQGHYQACARCDGYISCIGDRIYSRLCPVGLLWDDYVKGCRYISTTCTDFAHLKRKTIRPKFRRHNRRRRPLM